MVRDDDLIHDPVRWRANIECQSWAGCGSCPVKRHRLTLQKTIQNLAGDTYRLRPGRTQFDIALERKFFEQFILQILHPATGLPFIPFTYQNDSSHKSFAYQINLWEMGRQVGKTSDAGLLQPKKKEAGERQYESMLDYFEAIRSELQK